MKIVDARGFSLAQYYSRKAVRYKSEEFWVMAKLAIRMAYGL